ncbi:MAG: hypothetical protein EOO40_11615 [Deltaproteobacteria bacterium]|nr:MAG: hypothetical protein EOO40_11615 [Deltaproteobacteria bacterium]
MARRSFDYAWGKLRPAAPIARLLLLYERLLELLAWLSPATQAGLAGSSLDLVCRSLISQSAVDHYRARRLAQRLDLACLPGNRAVRRALKPAARQRQPLALYDRQEPLGHFTCVMK